MKERFLGSEDRKKNYDITGLKSTVQIQLEHFPDSDKIIVNHVNYGDGPKRTWKEHGQLKDLLLKFTGETFEGEREQWIRWLYYEKDNFDIPEGQGKKSVMPSGEFIVGEYYTRKDVYRIMNVPIIRQGGNWATGFVPYNNDSFIFANIGMAGKTGHNYPNKFDGNDLVWYGKNTLKLKNNSIQSLIDPKSNVYIFAREDNTRSHFMYIGNGKVKSVEDTQPIKIVWEFNNPHENHPEILSEEELEPEKLIEGAVKQIYVNVYERNPIARRKCIEHHGCHCNVCNFNFYDNYGDVGKDFIHVHHLKSLSEVGEEYEVDGLKDLRPVCPNCHAMLHRRKPAYSIEELKMMIFNRKEAVLK